MAVHATVGALAGNAVASPSLAFTLGFVSHFFMDMIPHGDLHIYDNYKRGDRVRTAVLYVAADAVMTAVLVTLFFIREDFFSPLAVAMGIVGGLLPDLLAGLVELWKPKRRTFLARKMSWFHGFHMRMHCAIIKHSKRFDRDIPFRYGLMLQGAVLAGLVIAIL
jgi:hypothetical protein